MKDEGKLPRISFTDAKDSFFDKREVMDVLGEKPEERSKRQRENIENVLSKQPNETFKDVMPVPDSVHGFWWKVARWEVFLGLFVLQAAWAAFHRPEGFVSEFLICFALYSGRLLASLALPAGLRWLTGKQGGIAVSAVSAGIAAVVFMAFAFWMYRGHLPPLDLFLAVNFLLTMVSGYKVVRKENGPRRGSL